MANPPYPQLCAWSLGLLLSCCPAWSPPEAIASPVEICSEAGDRVWQDLTKAGVVYLGETHNRAADHQLQLQILRELHRRNRNLAIAMEMFQRPYQGAIDRYLAGELTEAQLIEATEYEQRWGFPWEFYAPLLRFAKTHQIPVLALNAPSEISRQVARQGLDSLEESQQRYIPPLEEIRTDNAEYRQRLRAVFDHHQEHARGHSLNFENFFAAQVLWDETMAQRIAQFLEDNPGDRVIVMAGQGHVAYGDGIPSRVARRIPSISQQLVLLNPSELPESQRAIADILWKSDCETGEMRPSRTQ
jgi:uncharacterized iron-regulated protein